MSLGHGSSIVRDGLVLHLDAANVKSYPGSGAIWKDLSGNGNNGTLVNGVGYSSNNAGGLIFDGVNDYSFHSVSPIVGNSAFSITGFFYRTGSTIQRATWGIAGNSGLQGINSYSLTGSNLLSIDLWGSTTIQSNESYDLNQWIFAAWVYRGATFSRNNISIYKNGTEYTGSALTVARGSETSVPNINSSGLVIARAGTIDSGYSAPVLISSICFYNLPLSATQIAQNFNALRGRYGI